MNEYDTIAELQRQIDEEKRQHEAKLVQIGEKIAEVVRENGYGAVAMAAMQELGIPIPGNTYEFDVTLTLHVRSEVADHITREINEDFIRRSVNIYDLADNFKMDFDWNQDKTRAEVRGLRPDNVTVTNVQRSL